GGWSPMSIVFSKARKRLTCRCKRQRSTSWCSISGLQRRSALRCRQRCSPAPTRSLNEKARVHIGAAHAGGPRAQQAGKLETRALFAGRQGGTVAPAGGTTCAPRSVRLDLKAPAGPAVGYGPHRSITEDFNWILRTIVRSAA